jgi:hypothetical protein
MRKPTSSNDPVRSVGAEHSASDTRSVDSSRRRFLFALGAGSAGAAAVSSAVHAAVPEVAAEPAADDGAYRVTAHVRDYYRSTKI